MGVRKGGRGRGAKGWMGGAKGWEGAGRGAREGWEGGAKGWEGVGGAREGWEGVGVRRSGRGLYRGARGGMVGLVGVGVGVGMRWRIGGNRGISRRGGVG